ncbi:MAG: M14 family metallopeptidase [Rhodospirillales bacterium]
MSASRYFSATYLEAREGFRAAAAAAGAALESLANPGKGPGGEDLSTEAAWFGPRDPQRALVLVSGTHGVEGFCGSGCQIGWIAGGGPERLPAGVGVLVVHAINPHGFAWLRRVTEDNVDLNRNFADFAKPLPRNPAYDELAEAVCPGDWSERGQAAAQALLDAHAKKHGDFALQAAISGGQYDHPGGLFFGGKRPTWSRRIFTYLVQRHLGRARQVALIDFHTGLGPYGHGELICPHPVDSPVTRRAEAWFGKEMTVPARGNSASAVIVGTLGLGLQKALPNADVTDIGLEYGTLPPDQVILALRADNWLHLHGDVNSPQGRAIKKQIRAAFYPDKEDWKEMVLARALDVIRRAADCLAGA